MTEPGVIRLTRSIPFPPSAVWRALTEPDLLAAWWAPGDVKPVLGHEFTLDMGTFGPQRCTVLAVEPEREFSYLFGAGMLDTTITWHLEPSAEGTSLTLVHAGFNLDSPMGQMAFQGMGSGWPAILPKIDTVLEEASLA